jgi:hypothetical protein
MSGSAIIRYLLKTNTALIAVVPAARIKVGNIRQGDQLPAISVKKISGDPENTLAMAGTPYLVSHRIQVSLALKHGVDSGDVWALIRAALTPKPASPVNGFNVGAILPDSEGPELEDRQAQTDTSSADYMVWFYR